MKLNSFYPFVAGLCTALFFVWACTQVAPTPKATESLSTASTATAASIITDTGNIHPKKAQAAIKKWQNERNEINKKLLENEKMYVVKGFRVPVKDIAELFAALQAKKIEHIWAMMAIMDNPEETKDSTHLIFQAEERTMSKSGTATYQYYDYSAPCPKNCPPDL